jgi:hypothetical protein
MLRKKYNWTPEIDTRLRDIYATSASRRQFTASIRTLMAESGISRAMLHSRAARLGLRFISKRNWTHYEDQWLADNAGKLPIRRMAVILGRSKESISCQMQRLELSERWESGYSIQALAGLLGCSEITVKSWQRRGWLIMRYGRFPARTVRDFLSWHLEEVNLRRADDAWIKRQLRALIPRPRNIDRRVAHVRLKSLIPSAGKVRSEKIDRMMELSARISA